MSQSWCFSVVTYECESWTIKKAESRRIDAFELWCWRRLLRVPWTARRSNKSILKEISPEYYWKDWCRRWNSSIGHLMRRTNSLEKTLGKIEGREMTEDEMVGWHHQLDEHVWASSWSWWWTGNPSVLQSTGLQRVGNDWGTALNWKRREILWTTFCQ